MNKEIRVKGVRKIALGAAGAFLFLGFLLLPSCREETFPPPEFSICIDQLHHWTNKGWAGYPYREEKRLLDSICGRIQSEPNNIWKEKLYAQFTNELVNVPFFVTNGVQRTNEFPRGWYQPPYWDRIRAFRALVERAQERSLYTNRFDAFCLNLEMWKRLRREQKDCPRIVEMWMTLRYEDCPIRWIEDDIRESLAVLNQVEREVEGLLERFYGRDSEESRMAYELFRQVVGREAKPWYGQ